MFKKIFKDKKFLRVSNEKDLHLVLRLMFEIAISDGTLDKAELGIIKKQAELSDKNETSSSKIIKKIIDDSQNSTSLYPTVKRINEEYSKTEKIDLLKSLWKLIIADKMIDPYEENLYFKIADLIQIKRSLANKIKQEHS